MWHIIVSAISTVVVPESVSKFDTKILWAEHQLMRTLVIADLDILYLLCIVIAVDKKQLVNTYADIIGKFEPRQLISLVVIEVFFQIFDRRNVVKLISSMNPVGTVRNIRRHFETRFVVIYPFFMVVYVHLVEDARLAVSSRTSTPATHQLDPKKSRSRLTHF
jgi:hypothetical protein